MLGRYRGQSCEVGRLGGRGRNGEAWGGFGERAHEALETGRLGDEQEASLGRLDREGVGNAARAVDERSLRGVDQPTAHPKAELALVDVEPLVPLWCTWSGEPAPFGARCSITATRPSVVSLEALIVARTPRNQSASPSSLCSATGPRAVLALALIESSFQYFAKHHVSRCSKPTCLRGACQVSRYNVYHQEMGRSYQLKRRAERQGQTRQRIIEAAIELHQTIGPAATTVSEIAERAEVGRVTVYRHFPDEPSLARACSGQYFKRHPFPDPDRWRVVT